MRKFLRKKVTVIVINSEKKTKWNRIIKKSSNQMNTGVKSFLKKNIEYVESREQKHRSQVSYCTTGKLGYILVLAVRPLYFDQITSMIPVVVGQVLMPLLMIRLFVIWKI
ncbi:hypothetical protein JV59_28275 [Vibrio coralliilyticus]|nr:hypothetical protein JV59_28275 [Vibrio coralliilyticus]